MGKSEKRNGAKESAAALVRAGSKAEKRLLRREREAEQVLKSARARLMKAQHRLERRLGEVAAAEATLRGHQRARAVGPNDTALPGDGAALLLPATPAASSNGTAAAIITGPDVATELAAIEAATPPTPGRPARAPRARAAEKAPAPETPPVDLVVPVATTAAPKRSRPSRAPKPSGDAS